MSSRRAQIFNLVLFLFGLALLGVVLWRLDLEQVGSTIWRARWAVLGAFGVHVSSMLCSTLTWRETLDPSASSAGFGDLFAAFWAGAALNAVTPGSAAGTVLRGTILGDKVDGEAVTASLILFTYLMTLTNIGFAVGAAILAVSLLDLPSRIAIAAGVALGVMCIAALLLYAATRRGMAQPVMRLVQRVRLRKGKGGRLDERAASVDERVRRFRRQRPDAFARAVGYMILAKSLQVAAIWVLLVAVLPGPHPLYWTATWAVIVFGFYQILGWIVFFIPNRVGVNEGAMALMFQLMAFDPVLGLSFALLRRLRKLLEVIVGFCIAGVVQLRARAR